MGSSPSKDALAGGTGIVPGVSDAEHNPCVGPVSHDAVSIPHFLHAQAADGAPAGATPGGQIPQLNTQSTAPSAAATPPADGSESGGSAVATPPVAVPSISGIEAAVDLAAAAGAERDGDGLLLTQEVAQKGKVDFFSAHASMLSPFLRVSSAEPATRRALLHAAGVGVVVNAAADAVPCKFRRDGVPYTSLCVADTSSTELSNLFPAICALLKAAEQASVPALVHCHQGVSRSGTLAVAYIMWRWGADLDTAVAAARRVRGIISPNPGFRLQLQEWGWWLARWREGPAVSSLADLPWVPAGEAAAAGGVPRSSPDGKWTLCDVTLDPAAPLPVYSAARLAPGMFDALPPSFKVVPAEGKADTATGAVFAQTAAPGFAAFTCRKLLIPRRCDTTHLPLAPARDALASTSVTLLTHAPGGPLPPLAVWVGAEVAPEV
ncbi:MKP1, partial [Symbiodinium sp. KB8]